MVLSVMLIRVVGEYVAIGIAANVYLNLVEELADLTVIATVNIICALMDTSTIVFGARLVKVVVLQI